VFKRESQKCIIIKQKMSCSFLYNLYLCQIITLICNPEQVAQVVRLLIFSCLEFTIYLDDLPSQLNLFIVFLTPYFIIYIVQSLIFSTYFAN